MRIGLNVYSSAVIKEGKIAGIHSAAVRNLEKVWNVKSQQRRSPWVRYLSSYLNQIQIFHYTRCITPKRVTSLRDPSSHHCAGSTALFEEIRSGGGAVGNIVSDLTGSKFKPQTSRFRDERVTVRTTGRLSNYWTRNLKFNSESIYQTGDHLRQPELQKCKSSN